MLKYLESQGRYLILKPNGKTELITSKEKFDKINKSKKYGT